MSHHNSQSLHNDNVTIISFPSITQTNLTIYDKWYHFIIIIMVSHICLDDISHHMVLTVQHCRPIRIQIAFTVVVLHLQSRQSPLKVELLPPPRWWLISASGRVECSSIYFLAPVVLKVVKNKYHFNNLLFSATLYHYLMCVTQVYS